MISQVVLLPDSFEESNDSNMLIAILKDILNNGIYIVDFRTANWSKSIQKTYINEYEAPSLRDKILALVRQLKDRKKIIKITNFDHQVSDENDWLAVAKLHNEIESIDLVASGERVNLDCKSLLYDKCYNINDVLISDEWIEIKKRDMVLTKTPSDFEKVLKKLLPNVNKLQLIDPYILPKAQYKSTLNQCIHYLKNKRGMSPDAGIIEIHTKAEESLGLDVNKSRWKTFLQNLDNPIGHTIKVYFWKDKSPEDKFHDRFLLTNVYGISSTHSFDIKDNSNQETTWSYLDQDTFELHANNFSEEDPKFQLECDPLVYERI